MSITVGIVGGGAAGMTAAIAAARAGAKVTILERNDRLGKKILSTGNGRCNLGNECIDESFYYGDERFIRTFLERFNVAHLYKFWESCGLLIKSKDGYLYPRSEQAACVPDVLLSNLRSLNVEIRTECFVKRIRKENDKVILTAGGKDYSFDRVLIACGGEAAPKTGSDGGGYYLAKQLGHTIVDTTPALVQLRCKDDFCKKLAGVRADGCVKVYDGDELIAEEKGEIQFVDYGISGIPVFQISRIVNRLLPDRKQIKVCVDFFPEYSFDELTDIIKKKAAILSKNSTIRDLMQGLLNCKIIDFLLLYCNMDSNTSVKALQSSLDKLLMCCKGFAFTVTGSNSFDAAQVTAGGVALSEVSSEYESLLCPGVYFAGEVLDVDGKCGGYNLHFAWGSGMIAGTSAAGRKYDSN